MAKTKPSARASSNSSTLLHAPKAPRPRKSRPPPPPSTLLAEGSSLLVSSEADKALRPALRALSILQPPGTAPSASALPALNLLAQIQLELGDGDAARDYFLQAVELDSEGITVESEGGGVEKFLWLAQLSEEGGKESVEWFERGCEVLRRDLMKLEQEIKQANDTSCEEITPIETEVMDKMRKLAEALCGMVEIYMTDLSLEPEAEEQCENLIEEALLVGSGLPGPLQTLASVRISQFRTEEAKDALNKSVALWKEVDAEDEDSLIPDFPTRVSLARLLMEVSMLDEALWVLERLVSEDDQSVEAWYLGGWCLYLSAEVNAIEKGEERTSSLKSSRQWLRESLRLYQVLEYEDDRLRDHTMELVSNLNKELGEGDDDEAQEGGAEGDWEDEDGDGEVGDEDEDQEMAGT